MKKKIFALPLALLLCAAFLLPAFAAKYPAGVDESLPRVIDNDLVLMYSQRDALEEQIYQLIEKYSIDIVILTESDIGSTDPYVYADDYFDYEGYGWREEASDDIRTGSGVILLLVNIKGAPGTRDIEISCKGTAMAAFGVVDDILDNMIPLLADGKIAAACERFLRDTETRMRRYAAGDVRPTYAEGYSYVYDDDGASSAFNTGVFLVGLVAAALIAWADVAAMKKKMNTARKKTEACDYMRGDSFRLTQQQDTFLYSNTSRVRIDSGGGSSGGSSGGVRSGGGARTSSSGSSHSGGGRRF